MHRSRLRNKFLKGRIVANERKNAKEKNFVLISFMEIKQAKLW